MDSENEKDSLEFTPEMMLADLLREIREGKYKDDPPCKAVVLLLWDEPDGNYQTSFWNAGMSTSQLLALLAVNNHKLLRLISGGEY